ncbi:MAG: MaoC family dehydratase [Bacteroidota bacterium]
MIQVGEVYKTDVRYSQEQVIAFSQVSGDANPLHLDADYAATTIFKKPIVHGFLTGSIFSKVFGMDFPGPGSVYLGQTMQFKRPMFVETDYEAVFTVISVDREKHSAVIETKISEKATGKVTLSGEAQILNTSAF